MGHDVFVSHSSKDKLFADALVAHLERSGIRCWVAPRDMMAGENWAGSILKAIANSKLMVLVFSTHTNSSNHIRREVERAVHHGIPVAPVRIADAHPTDDLEYFLSSSHWIDAVTLPMEEHFAKLAEQIKALLNFPSAAAPVASDSAGAPPVVSRVTTAPPNRRRPWLVTGSAVAAGLVFMVLGVIALIISRDHSQPKPALSPSATSGQPPSASIPAAPLISVLPAPPSAPPAFDSNNSSGPKPSKIGDTWTNSLGMTFAYIPAGTFVMGSPSGEPGRNGDEIQHKVTLTKSFLMGTTDVTQARWKAVMEDNLSDNVGDDFPVDRVSYASAVRFCKMLSAKEGRHYRLPTEAEWEYASRAGTTTTYFTGGDEKALADAGWYVGNSDKQTHPVGQKMANAWGLYDMLGNVWQWSSDWYGKYSDGETSDPQGPDNGTARVLRGGCWDSNSRDCRCAARGQYRPLEPPGYFGLRPVLDSVAVAPVVLSPPLSMGRPPDAKISGSPKPSKIGDTWTNSLGMTFAYIPAGTFVMGSPADEADREGNETQHKVTLTKSFLMGTTPVTQARWKAVMGDNPSEYAGDDLPVDRVSYAGALAFCKMLSAKEGRRYRLPTEAEWEYACRAGTTTTYYTGGDEKALADAGWYAGNSDKQTHPVGQKNANAWGLYDMLGNVWQWCSDWYGGYPGGDATDPQGPNFAGSNGTARVLRGGSWDSNSRDCRCAARGQYRPLEPPGYFGLRPVLDSE
jgi:formylglycine-generating enzyme required for sulfatase activity